MSMSSFAQLAQPPVWGYDHQDMGGPGVVDYSGGNAATASISASGGIQDLATGNVTVDTSVPLRGFLFGIAVLVLIRVFWEAMED